MALFLGCRSIGYVGYKLYQYGTKSKQKLYESAEYLIRNAEEKSALLYDIKKRLNLPSGASKDETLQAFSQITSHKEKMARDLITMAQNDHPLDAEDAITHYKENVVQVADEGADTAIKSIGAAYTSVLTAGSVIATTNTQTISNISSVLGPNTGYATIPNLTGITIQLSEAEVTSGMIGGAIGSVGAVAITLTDIYKELTAVPLPKTAVTKEQALQQLVALRDSLPTKIGFEKVADAVKVLVRDYAQKSGAIVTEDQKVLIDIPLKKEIAFIEKAENNGTIQVEQRDEADMILITADKKPVVIPDIDLEYDNISVTIPLEENTHMSIHTKETSSDTHSVTYRVTVNVTQVKTPVEISIDLQNAATGISTKTLTSDGSINWDVTVLDQDATITIKRNDTGKTVSFTLKGMGLEGREGCSPTYNADLDPDGDHTIVINTGRFEDRTECIYYPSGTLEWNIPFKDNKINGLRKSYFESGQLREITPYTDGRRNGIEKGYYPSGQVKYMNFYENDLKEKMSIEYYENGNARRTTHWKHGLKDGREYEYDENGNLIHCKLYQNGVFIKYLK